METLLFIYPPARPQHSYRGFDDPSAVTGTDDVTCAAL